MQMNIRSKSRNPLGFWPNNSVTTPNVMGRSVLLPSVGSIMNKKHRQTPQGHVKSPYERSALTPPNRSRSNNAERARPQSNKVNNGSMSNLVPKKKSNGSK